MVAFAGTERPVSTPVTMPVEEPTVAVPVALLLQVPPAGISPSAVVSPWHTESVPVIADGSALTVTTVVRIQPVTGKV